MINRLLHKDGKLAKLTIRAFFDKERRIPIPGAEFKAMFNPTEYTKKYVNTYAQKKGINNIQKELVHQNTEAQELNFNFLIDGSGATGEKVEVSKKIKEFLYVVYDYSGKLKKAKPLKLHWGDEVSKCVLTSAEVNYTMFRSNGSPLRATIKATFKEDISNIVIERLYNNLSAAADQIRKIKDGDTLVTLAQDIYGNIDRLAEIAEVNELDTLRVLPKDSNILFPSF